MSLVFLVGVDCSDCGTRALEYAAERAKLQDAKLLVAHVIEWSPFQFSTVQENEERHKRREEEIQRAHSEIVDPIVQSLRDRGIDAEGLVRHGHVAETLDDLAHEYEVTNIMLGRLGSSGLRRHLFGTVSSTLVQIADVPVTVVP
jgi:nucleotide-binding universal stress UspA family protein